MPLRIPVVLAFTIVGASAGCRDSKPPIDAMACSVRCVPQGAGSNGCTPPTCAEGSNHDICPQGCVPEPIV